ncbi:CHASE3 domain-containing protein [Cytophagaceae bacterium YF14B1]|uniref:histidine kinase n=1 Tax=Xanthocytophaga flava TaxID=3048013 RepID=A0AAE3UBB4_9BACT|nr:CHASE3 domain-containing protein [Xanthocytophaga flavus]MDJ1485612.1 CHASE3 domain-containing protein [Xanthocytophaga flavus]
MAQKDQKLRITFFIAYLTGALVLLLTGLLAYQSMRLLIDKSKWVNHTHQVLLTTETVLSLLKDAESGQRGYSLTKDSTYLEASFQGIDSVEYSIIRLESLTRDNPTQQARIPAIWQAVQKKIEVTVQGIELTNTHPEKMNEFYQSKVGKQRMDQIKRLLFIFEQEEHRLLGIRTRELDQSILRAQYSIYWIIISYVLIVLLTFTVIKYLLQKREGYESQLTLLNEQLQQTNDELAHTNQQLAHTNEELQTTNEELLITNERLHYSNTELERFAYVASHDLQEPLRKIQVFAHTLKIKYSEALGEGTSLLERMQSAANRMSTLIKDLLTLSRLTASQQPQGRVALDQVLSHVLTHLELRIEETAAQIQIDPLPVITGDSLQLEQLFLNLLSNSLKFSHKDIPPHITIHYQKVTKEELPVSLRIAHSSHFYHRIAVSDNGIGFEAEYAERIFQVFQRLHGKNEYEGTGIGLAICQKVVLNHHGAIIASSQKGQGATFTLFLPVECPVVKV